MNEMIVRILSENPTHYFATVGLDGRPKVRPFGFMMVEGGKLYYCTNNTKEVYAQLQRLPDGNMRLYAAVPVDPPFRKSKVHR